MQLLYTMKVASPRVVQCLYLLPLKKGLQRFFDMTKEGVERKTEVVVINQLGAFQSVIATSLKKAITMFCLFHHTNMLDIIPCHHQEDQLIIASLFSLYPTMTSYHAIIMENKPLWQPMSYQSHRATSLYIIKSHQFHQRWAQNRYQNKKWHSD